MILTGKAKRARVSGVAAVGFSCIGVVLEAKLPPGPSQRNQTISGSRDTGIDLKSIVKFIAKSLVQSSKVVA